jgi:hypothetical protein
MLQGYFHFSGEFFLWQDDISFCAHEPPRVRQHGCPAGCQAQHFVKKLPSCLMVNASSGGVSAQRPASLRTTAKMAHRLGLTLLAGLKPVIGTSPVPCWCVFHLFAAGYILQQGQRPILKTHVTAQHNSATVRQPDVILSFQSCAAAARFDFWPPGQPVQDFLQGNVSITSPVVLGLNHFVGLHSLLTLDARHMLSWS